MEDKKRFTTKVFIVFSLLVVALVGLTGCEYCNDWKYNRKYKGRVFKIRVLSYEEGKTKTLIWENAINLSYDKEENVYTFYVYDKSQKNENLIEIYPKQTVIIEEQSVESFK